MTGLYKRKVKVGTNLDGFGISRCLDFKTDYPTFLPSRSRLIKSVSAVLPAFNEELNIEECVEAVIKAFEALKLEAWEIVVVDDGSVDRTLQILASLAEKDKRLKYVSHEENRGYGVALCSGLSAAKLEWIFITDSDLQFYPEELSALVPFSSDFDFIQGVRRHRADPLGRILLGRIYRSIVHLLFKMPVKDPECSFRLIKRDLLEGSNFVCSGPMVPVELVYRAQLANARFKDIDVRHRERAYGETNALNFRTMMQITVDFIQIIKVLTKERFKNR